MPAWVIFYAWKRQIRFRNVRMRGKDIAWNKYRTSQKPNTVNWTTMSRVEKEISKNNICTTAEPSPAYRSSRLSNSELRRQLGWGLIEMTRSIDDKIIDESFPSESR